MKLIKENNEINMNKPLLSICIPTYNRAEYLDKTLNSIVSSEIFIRSNDVEIIISNNCSSDNTNEVCLKYVNKYPDKIKYIEQNTPIFADLHIFKTIEYATGKFCKLNNDTCTFLNNSLDYIVDYLKNNQNDNFIFFNYKNDADETITKHTSFDSFIKQVSYFSTWIANFCIKKSVYNSIDNPLRLYLLKLPQVDIIGRIFENNLQVTVLEKKLFNSITPYKKGGNYNVAEVFGKNYFDILSKFLDRNNGITCQTFEAEKDSILEFINEFYFDKNKNYSFNKNGYLRHMLKYFKNKPNFYKKYVIIQLEKFFETKKTETHKIYKILFIKFKFKRK